MRNVWLHYDAWGDFHIPDVVDEVLRVGGNREGSQLRIIYNFMIEQTPEEYTEFCTPGIWNRRKGTCH